MFKSKNEEMYVVKELSSFRTVFFGTLDEVDKWLANPDHNGKFEIYKESQLKNVTRCH